MGSFDFITVAEFRSSLEADFREMLACDEAGSWKAVHVLAGSIVEAVLVDLLIAEGIASEEEGWKLSLGDAISRSREGSLISQRVADLSSVVRGYRNLIHPGRVLRLGERVTRDSAQVAKALVNIVLEEVAHRRRKHYGYTAEQIAGKLERDSSATVIVEHLLKETNEKERERLMLAVLPERYLNAIESEDNPPHILPALTLCFRQAFEKASAATKRRVAQRFVSIVKEESEYVVFSYGTAFLRASYLQHVSADDARIVKDHLLSRLSQEPDLPVIEALEGVGRLLTKSDIDRFVDPLVRMVCTTGNAPLRDRAKSCLTSEWFGIQGDLEKPFKKRLEAWAALYREKGMADKAEQVERILNETEDVPF